MAAGAQFTVPSSSLTSAASFPTFDTSSGNWLGFQISGTFVASLVVEGSYNNGTTWAAIPVNDVNGTVAGGIITAPGIFSAQALAPLTRVRVSSYTSGTVTLAGGSTVTDTAPLGVSNSPVPGVAHFLLTAATVNNTLVKSGPTQLFAVDFTNTAGTPVYLKFFNKATAPAAGVDTPVLILTVAANATLVQSFGGTGKQFPLGLGYCTTGAMSGADATAILANALVGITYR